MHAVAQYKQKIVDDIVKLTREYPIIGIVNMEDLPAPQLQAMRSELRGKIDLYMTKKRFMKIALDKIKDEKKGIEEFETFFEGMPALIFTKENPFKLSKILKKSRTKAPAKGGQIAPDDITIKKGPTPFAPGPIISELSSAGLKVGVENGKVAVKEDTIIVKKGEKIKPNVAEILTRLDIKPMEVGLGLIATYEDGIIYKKDILEVDEVEFNNRVNLAATSSFNLAFYITYITKENITLLLSKAFRDAKAIGVSQLILDKDIVEDLMSNAERSMLSLKSEANIETPKKEEIKTEDKKIEAPKKEEIIQKEKQVLKEEKKIIEEEKKLEQEKPSEVPVEKEVQQEVKKVEEIKLEKERIEKEKELERVEKQKQEVKPKPQIPESTSEIKKEVPTPEPKPQPEVKPIPVTKKESPNTDEKVKQIVENTKKFVNKEEKTAADLIEDIKKEEIQEQKKDSSKVPSAHDLSKQKTKEINDHKEVEDLTKELLKKGTLRKK